MAPTSEEPAKEFDKSEKPKTLVVSHLLLIATITAHTLLKPGVSIDLRLASIAWSVAFVFLVMLRFFDLNSIEKHPRRYLFGYYALGVIGLVFIAGPATSYSLAWFFILVIASYLYGKKGVLVTAGLFGLASIAKLVYLMIQQGLTTSEKLSVIAPLLIFGAIASLINSLPSKGQATENVSVSQDLELEQRRMRALINNMTETVLVLDANGIVQLYNAAALALLDTNTSLTSKPLDNFIKIEDEKGNKITTLELLPKDTKPIMRNDLTIRYSQEDKASISIVVTPIRSTFGHQHEEAGYVMTMRDITREKSLEEERDEFISVISHELRTPVTVAEAGISNSMLLAEQIEGNEKIKASLKTAHDQAIFLATMLNDLTTFARAEKGALDMKLEEFSPRELLENLLKDYQANVDGKGMHIEVLADPSTPEKITSNRLYVREILQNFITNAIKYSDKGTVSLLCHAKDNGVLFSVRDQGIGISTSDQKKVFEKFFRAEDYRTRSTNGTGLGLYIVKKLAKILSASFELESEVGKGSTFSLYVPSVENPSKPADTVPTDQKQLDTQSTS